MELKLLCPCGQKFKFDVVPVDGALPFAVNCPKCGTDGTAAANEMLAQTTPLPPSLPPLAGIPAANALRMDQQEPLPMAAPGPARSPRPITPMLAPTPKDTGEFNLMMGVVGAVLGALIGAAIMFGVYQFGHFRFPLFGVGIGFLTGYGARLLGKGSDQTLGIIAAVIALGSVVGTLYCMYGEFPMFNIISVIISAVVANRVVNR